MSTVHDQVITDDPKIKNWIKQSQKVICLKIHGLIRTKIEENSKIHVW